MTFYRLFDNKIALAKTVLDEVFDKATQRYRNIMAQDIPFPEKIQQTILLKKEGTQEISQELIMDIYKNEETELIDFMAEKRKQGTNDILHTFTIAQRKGWLRKDVKPEFIVYFIGKINEMVTDEQLLAMYKSLQALIMELTNFFFYGISSKDDQ